MWLRKFKTIVARTSRRDKSRQQRPISGMRIKAREEQNADTSISYLGYADQRKTLTGPQRPILGMRIKAREKHRPTSGMSIKARALGTATTYLGHADQRTRKTRTATTYLGHADTHITSGMRITAREEQEQQRATSGMRIRRACGSSAFCVPTSGMRIPLRPTSGVQILKHLSLYDLPRACGYSHCTSQTIDNNLPTSRLL